MSYTKCCRIIFGKSVRRLLKRVGALKSVVPNVVPNIPNGILANKKAFRTQKFEKQKNAPSRFLRLRASRCLPAVPPEFVPGWYALRSPVTELPGEAFPLRCSRGPSLPLWSRLAPTASSLNPEVWRYCSLSTH